MHYAMSKEIIIKSENLKKVFRDAGKSVVALEAVNLTIEKGEYLAIVGPSGAGKSTLIHILGGLDYPSNGEVYFEGRNLNSYTSRQIFKLRNKKIGFMFQFYHLIPELTVLENIVLPALLAGYNKKIIFNKVQKQADRLGIQNRLSFYPNQLSGGQQQKVALARALTNEPDVLFCDEPTGNLDHDSSIDIRNLLNELNQANNTTIILVTHNLELAKDAKRVLNISEGKVLYS